MVGMQVIGSGVEAAAVRLGPLASGAPPENGAAGEEASKEVTPDVVQFSKNAQDVSRASDLLTKNDELREVEKAEIEKARKQLEAGIYKIQEVVMLVAGRLTPYLKSAEEANEARSVEGTAAAAAHSG